MLRRPDLGNQNRVPALGQGEFSLGLPMLDQQVPAPTRRSTPLLAPKLAAHLTVERSNMGGKSPASSKQVTCDDFGLVEGLRDRLTPVLRERSGTEEAQLRHAVGGVGGGSLPPQRGKGSHQPFASFAHWNSSLRVQVTSVWDTGTLGSCYHRSGGRRIPRQRSSHNRG